MVAAISYGISIVPAPALAFNPWLTVFSHKAKGLNMRRIKIGIKDMPLPRRILAGRQVVESLTNNPHFPDAGPWRDMLLAATNALEAGYNDAQSSRQITASKISFQHEKAREFNLLMSQIASWVANQSALDPTKVLSTGFGLCATNKAIGPLPAPKGFTVSPAERAGALDFFWKKVRGAKSYMIEYALDAVGELEWKALPSTTKIKASTKGLVSGQKYWFRMLAIGAAGQSPPSAPVAKFAP